MIEVGKNGLDVNWLLFLLFEKRGSKTRRKQLIRRDTCKNYKSLSFAI